MCACHFASGGRLCPVVAAQPTASVGSCVPGMVCAGDVASSAPVGRVCARRGRELSGVCRAAPVYSALSTVMNALLLRLVLTVGEVMAETLAGTVDPVQWPTAALRSWRPKMWPELTLPDSPVH